VRSPGGSIFFFFFFFHFEDRFLFTTIQLFLLCLFIFFFYFFLFFFLLAELGAPAEKTRLLETEFWSAGSAGVAGRLAACGASWGVVPGAVVGHSAGEVGAAWLAGVLSLEEAVLLAVERGRFLQRAAAGGRMAQVELSEDEVREALAGLEERLAIAASTRPARCG